MITTLLLLTAGTASAFAPARPRSEKQTAEQPEFAEVQPLAPAFGDILRHFPGVLPPEAPAPVKEWSNDDLLALLEKACARAAIVAPPASRRARVEPALAVEELVVAEPAQAAETTAVHESPAEAAIAIAAIVEPVAEAAAGWIQSAPTSEARPSMERETAPPSVTMEKTSAGGNLPRWRTPQDWR